MESVLKRDICHPVNNCHHWRILVVTCAVSLQIDPIRNAECLLTAISGSASPSELFLCSRAHSNCLAQRLVFGTFFGGLCMSVEASSQEGARQGWGAEWLSHPGQHSGSGGERNVLNANLCFWAQDFARLLSKIKEIPFNFFKFVISMRGSSFQYWPRPPKALAVTVVTRN